MRTNLYPESLHENCLMVRATRSSNIFGIKIRKQHMLLNKFEHLSETWYTVMDEEGNIIKTPSIYWEEMKT